MIDLDDVLLELAPKYLWWKGANDPSFSARRVIAQIMNIGDFADVQRVAGRLGESVFRDALEHAEPGWFTPRSWSYWNHRLDLTDDGVVADAPKRRFE